MSGRSKELATVNPHNNLELVGSRFGKGIYE
jgi:hypothetical protein